MYYNKGPNKRRPTFINFQEKSEPLRALIRTLRLLIFSCKTLAMWYASSTTNKSAENQVQIALFVEETFDESRHFAKKSKHIGFSRVMSLFLACIDTL